LPQNKAKSNGYSGGSAKAAGVGASPLTCRHRSSFVPQQGSTLNHLKIQTNKNPDQTAYRPPVATVQA
jgi:hypothetical protein